MTLVRTWAETTPTYPVRSSCRRRRYFLSEESSTAVIRRLSESLVLSLQSASLTGHHTLGLDHACSLPKLFCHSNPRVTGRNLLVCGIATHVVLPQGGCGSCEAGRTMRLDGSELAREHKVCSSRPTCILSSRSSSTSSCILPRDPPTSTLDEVFGSSLHCHNTAV